MNAEDSKGERSIRKSANVAQQKIALIYLVMGGLVFFTIALGAALFSVGRSGVFAQRAAVEVVQRYMDHGRTFETLAAHRLYSVEALAATSEDDVVQIFSARRFFDGFETVELRSAESVSGSGLALEALSIEAIATYSSAPPALIRATVEQADGTWRLRTISFGELEPTSP